MVAVSLATATNASAEKSSFIRDAEIENTIRTFVTPVFQAAGLEPSAVEVYIVNDPTLNAFVAGGQKIFVNTGLLTKVNTPSALIGVLAHEAGHIAGGHLVRTHEELRNIRAQQIISTVLGAAIGIGSRRGDVGGAVVAGGQDVAMRSLLQYSRTQEYAADAAAMRYLDATGQTTEGMLNFMKVFEDQELLGPRHQDPYLRTHPMSHERILAMREHVARSPYSGRPESPVFVAMLARLKAKLIGFINSPGQTLRMYPESDTSVAARYARAIAYYRRPELDRALPLVDGLIAESPQDPYFQELKGQILFENARIAESIEPYTASVRLLPTSGLLRLNLARAQLEMNDPALLDDAVTNLQAALNGENESAFVWRQLAIAYGRQNNMAMSAMAMAEEALLRGDKKAARFHAGKAETLLPAGSPAALKAQDILRLIDKDKDEDEKPK